MNRLFASLRIGIEGFVGVLLALNCAVSVGKGGYALLGILIVLPIAALLLWDARRLSVKLRTYEESLTE
jgi:hypothetical protein